MAILTCGFGETGARKTTAMGRAARYMYERTGLPSRAIYSDMGNWQVIRGEVEAGIIEPFLITGEPNMLQLLHKLARGEWPAKIQDGIAVERHPVDPKDPTGIGDAKMLKTPDLGSKIGAYFWEGLSSTSDLLMKYLRDYRVNIKGEVPSQFQSMDKDSGKATLFCANSLAHFGYTQDEMIVSLLAEFSALPVERVFITAHESEGTDEETREPIRGPALAGKKGTNRIGKNLGDLFHFDVYNKTDAAKGTVSTDVRVFYKNHPDPKFPNITYKCKTRVPEQLVAELERKFPGGYFSPTQFDEFLAFYDSLMDKAAADATEWRRKVDAARKAK